MDLSSLLHNEFEKRRNKNPRYSLRAFAKSLSIEAGALLRIMNNTRVATQATARSLLNGLNISPMTQKEILEALDIRRSTAFKATKKSGMTAFSVQEFENYFDILHIHVLEALNLKQFKNVDSLPDLAESLNVSLLQLNEVVNRLAQIGAVEIKGDQFNVLYKSFSTVPIPFTTEKRKALQKEFLKKAQDAIDTIPFELRDNSTLTIPLSEKDLASIKMILKRARMRINKVSEKRTKRDQLYNVSLALYPVVL
ncbi:DUF4423 domain-containing protein [Bdellovibrio bacteriovorus]|uniref:DUF4423 domain-containing protein n=1 Tax=Bdellovibrio TaxID=958 RepID=UPI0035A9AA3F